MRLRPWAVAGISLLGMELLYGSLLTFEPRAHLGLLMIIVGALFGVYAAAVLLRGHLRPGIVFAGAALFRLTLLPLGLPARANVPAMMREDLAGRAGHFRSNLLFDDDVWRYLWDGHVLASGQNPYRAAPAEALTVDEPWRTIRRNINHAGVPTIYPPVSQLLFLFAHALAPGSLVALKGVLIACDLLAIALIAGCLRRLGRASNEVLLYAWNPLVILMFAGAAHIDVLMLMLLSLSMYLLLRGSNRAAGVALGLATMTKLAPFVVWPLFIRRSGKSGSAALLATTAICATPFLVPGRGIQTFHLFATSWDFNSATFELLRRLARPFTADPDAWARVIALALLAAALAWIDRHIHPFPDAAMNALSALIVLSPAVMPWYATWPLAFVATARHRTLAISFSALVCLSFPMTADWKTHSIWLAAEWGGLAVLAFVTTMRNQTARQSVIPAEAAS